MLPSLAARAGAAVCGVVGGFLVLANRLVSTLARGLFALAGGALVVMMLVVLANVATRALFGATDGRVDLTFPGGVELVGFGLLATVLLALPHALTRGQVVVEVFTARLPVALRRGLEGVFLLGFGLLGGAMAWRFAHAAQVALASGEVSQDLLIPMALPLGLACGATAMLGLRGLTAGLVALIGREPDAIPNSASHSAPHPGRDNDAASFSLTQGRSR